MHSDKDQLLTTYIYIGTQGLSTFLNDEEKQIVEPIH